ncbi:MAG: 4-hydroxybenzoate octaprenyltransferase [Gammaproteobacteria bacterium]|nr:4-hydroxybenzoate octaprenyltransferase [Gammaproteobacteria bacterium]
MGIQKYLYLIRFDKPIGTILLLWPTLWALWVAGHGTPSLLITCIFIIGVFLMRSLGCILNDLADRNFDGMVTRTRHRPLVTSDKKTKVTVKQALLLASMLSLVAFSLILILDKLLDSYQLLWHSVVALVLASFYPFGKRFFACPQFILGIAFGYAIPMVFVALSQELTYITWLLYSASIILTVIYDSFYAMADITDDLKLQLKSSAIWFGKYDLYIIGCLQLLLLINLMTLGYLLEFKRFYFFIGLVLLLCIYQLKLAGSRKPADCLAAFKNNGITGLVIFLGFVSEYIL